MSVRANLAKIRGSKDQHTLRKVGFIDRINARAPMTDEEQWAMFGTNDRLLELVANLVERVP